MKKPHSFAADANIDVVTIQYLFCGGFAPLTESTQTIWVMNGQWN